MDFELAVSFVFAQEGGFQADPQDPGNWTGGAVGKGELKGTNFGISAAAYPSIDIRNLTRDDATHIYRRDYWIPIGGDALPPGIDLFALDAAVNQGLITVRDMQQAARVVVDGIAGPKTLAACKGPAFLARYATLRSLRYARAKNFSKYGEGWFIRLFAAYSRALAAMQSGQSVAAGSP